MTNTRNTPVEAFEYVYPVRILAYGLRDASGGTGKQRGGDGVRRVYEFLSPATVSFLSERRIIAPYELYGGSPGQVGINRLVRAGVEEILGGKHTRQVEPGDQIIIETPGGGGWGSA